MCLSLNQRKDVQIPDLNYTVRYNAFFCFCFIQAIGRNVVLKYTTTVVFLICNFWLIVHVTRYCNLSCLLNHETQRIKFFLLSLHTNKEGYGV